MFRYNTSRMFSTTPFLLNVSAGITTPAQLQTLRAPPVSLPMGQDKTVWKLHIHHHSGRMSWIDVNTGKTVYDRPLSGTILDAHVFSSDYRIQQKLETDTHYPLYEELFTQPEAIGFQIANIMFYGFLGVWIFSVILIRIWHGPNFEPAE